MWSLIWSEYLLEYLIPGENIKGLLKTSSASGPIFKSRKTLGTKISSVFVLVVLCLLPDSVRKRIVRYIIA